MRTEDSEDLEPIGPYHRLRCLCCGCPTLEFDHGDTRWPQDCLLCDWVNAGPHEAAGDEDGLSLEQARANVARFNWMYDPDALPDWLPHKLPPEELEARAALKTAYAAIDADTRGLKTHDLWDDALSREKNLRALVDARVRADVDEADEEAAEASDAPDDESDSEIEETTDGADDDADRSAPNDVTPIDVPSTPSNRPLGAFDYPGPPRGAAVIAAVSSANTASIATAVLQALGTQQVMLYGSGFVSDGGAPHVVAVLPTNARPDAAEEVKSFLLAQPGVLAAYIDRREGTAK